jgi:nucleotidyltransferase/DNA polymerase involved in DNA repair
MSELLVSDDAVCVWIPLFPLRCEAERRPDLVGQPVGLFAPDAARQLWQVSPAARRFGARPGMTVSQAIGVCPTLALIEPDPVFYDERFASLLHALNDVSPVVEPVELGKAFVGVDGLEGLYGTPERVIAAIMQAVARWTTSAIEPRLGRGRGKFVSWVAATKAKPGECVFVGSGEHKTFLAAQSLAALPLDADTYRRLWQLGLKTLGDIAQLPETALIAQFGRAGGRFWRLAAGVLTEPVAGRERPEPIVVAIDLSTPLADRVLLQHAIERLLDRALAHPRRTGWRVHTLRVRAALEQGTSWLFEITLKDPTADRARLAASVAARLEHAPPQGAVERLAVEFTGFTPGTTELQLFAKDAVAAARAQQRRALRVAADEICLRFRRSLLSRIIAVHPWSRIPERRYALIDFEP